jgi:hypothetical protein
MGLSVKVGSAAILKIHEERDAIEKIKRSGNIVFYGIQIELPVRIQFKEINFCLTYALESHDN